jgi:hypothetical protein
MRIRNELAVVVILHHTALLFPALFVLFEVQ